MGLSHVGNQVDTRYLFILQEEKRNKDWQWIFPVAIWLWMAGRWDQQLCSARADWCRFSNVGCEEREPRQMTWWSKIQAMYAYTIPIVCIDIAIYDAICSKWKTHIWSPSQNIHIVFLGWVQYLNVQWGLGGFGTAHALRCLLLPPPRNVLHSSEVQEFAMFTGLLCARLAGFPCQLGEKTIHCSCSCCTRNVWTPRYEFSEHRFFFQFFRSSISVFFALGGFDGNDEEWQEQYQVLGLNSFICGDSGMVGWFQLTNWRLLIH